MLFITLLACMAPSPDKAPSGDVDTAQAVAEPQTFTLITRPEETHSEGFLLETGVLTLGSGDFFLNQSRVLTLISPASDAICAKGDFATIEAIPSDLEDCPAGLSGSWEGFVYLGGASIHTEAESPYVGLGVLMWDAAHLQLYRLYIAGDSYSADGVSTVTFSYVPVP